MYADEGSVQPLTVGTLQLCGCCCDSPRYLGSTMLAGKSDVHGLDIEDLRALTMDASAITGVRLVGLEASLSRLGTSEEDLPLSEFRAHPVATTKNRET